MKNPRQKLRAGYLTKRTGIRPPGWSCREASKHMLPRGAVKIFFSR